jgi:ATP-dependent exoDNAse (exonuclease V) alpha subunit
LPIIRIDDCDDDVINIEEEAYNGDRYGTNDSQLFAVGSDVMMIMNLWTDAGLVNSACGTVVGIVKSGSARKARVLMVDFPTYQGPAFSIQFPTVVLITQVCSRKLNGIPLTSSWAITIHKSQGMTLDHVTIDLGDSEYSSGLTFVVLSHAKSFLGLQIRTFDFDRFRRIITHYG